MLGSAKQSWSLANAGAQIPPLLATGHSSSPFLSVYEYDEASGSLTKLDNPATLPGNIVYAAAWNPDGDILVCGGVTTRFIAYRYVDGALVKIDDPDVLPAGTTYAITWNSAGTMVIVSCSSGDLMIAYSWNGSTFTKITDAFSEKPTTGFYPGLTFNSDDTVLLASGAWTTTGDNPGSVWQWSVSGSSFTFDQRLRPVQNVTYGVDISPDDQHMATVGLNTFSNLFPEEVGHPLQIHKLDGDIYTNWLDTAIDTQPVLNTLRQVEYTRDGSNLLAVAHYVSPYVTLYQRSGDSYTEQSNPSTLPSGNGFSCSWYNGGSSLAVGHQNSPYVTVYTRSGTTLTKISNPATTPTGTVYAVAWNQAVIE